MDPISQAVLGASASQSVASRKEIAIATVLGLLAGMSADLDVFIRSNTDPLLFLEYHRQFTHSLIFIPIGGSLCAGLLHFLIGKKRSLPFRKTWLYCTIGYATHAMLDSCTTYGTMLFWPFSDTRIAWNNLSVVDPLFTLPLLVLIILAWKYNNIRFAKFGICWVMVYALVGWMQKERAESLGLELATQRGHVPDHLGAKPSFGNMILWKIVYEYDGRYYVDAVRVGFTEKIFPGESIKKLDRKNDFPWLKSGTQQALDLERFNWFSSGYLAVDQRQENLIVDVRYSMLPNEIHALWGISLNPEANKSAHVSYIARRDGASGRLKRLLQMLFDYPVDHPVDYPAEYPLD